MCTLVTEAWAEVNGLEVGGRGRSTDILIDGSFNKSRCPWAAADWWGVYVYSSYNSSDLGEFYGSLPLPGSGSSHSDQQPSGSDDIVRDSTVGVAFGSFSHAHLHGQQSCISGNQQPKRRVIMEDSSRNECLIGAVGKIKLKIIYG